MANSFSTYRTEGTAALQPKRSDDNTAHVISFEEARKGFKRQELLDQVKFEAYVAKNEVRRAARSFCSKRQLLNDLLVGSLKGTSTGKASTLHMVLAGCAYSALAVVALVLASL